MYNDPPTVLGTPESCIHTKFNVCHISYTVQSTEYCIIGWIGLCTHVRMYARTHTHARTYIHTHTQTHTTEDSNLKWWKLKNCCCVLLCHPLASAVSLLWFHSWLPLWSECPSCWPPALWGEHTPTLWASKEERVCEASKTVFLTQIYSPQP